MASPLCSHLPSSTLSGGFSLRGKLRCKNGTSASVVLPPSSQSSHHLSSSFGFSLLSPTMQKSKTLRSGYVTKRGIKVEAVAGSKKGFQRTIVAPDYRIPIVLLGTAGALFVADQKLAAAPIGLLGAFLLVQTTRVRFLFDEDAIEVVIGEAGEPTSENVFVGGRNRWKYDTFTNWEFWWPGFPVLVYFKETQTKPEGQVHFFPIIADGKQLYDLMVERCGPSMNSGPK